MISLLALAAARPAGATIVRPLSLDDIVRKSAVAFEGTCVGNRIERDAATNLVVTYTTFSVRDVIKGDVGGTYTIKQVGGRLAEESIVFEAHGVPRFVEGEEYVVFLAGVSRSGFSSPIGLSQGRFNVQRTAAGAEVANGRDFREMTSDIPEQELPPGLVQKIRHAAQPVRHLGLEEFKQLARQRAGAPR